MNTKIWVFGSNLAGRHGAGSAKVALQKYGAVYGCGLGRTGNAFAIPTKDKNLKILSLLEIEKYIKQFIWYAREHPELDFTVVKIGCGLAGYKPEQIIPMFDGASTNVYLPEGWLDVLMWSSSL